MLPFQYNNDDILSCDNVTLADIAKTYKTPCYLYSENHIKFRVNELQSALNRYWTGSQKPFIAYAMKANSNRSILQLMHSLGCGVDIVSGGELVRARAAGIPASSIIFSGVGKTDDELTLALQEQIGQINIESAAELERLDTLTFAEKKSIKIALRFTPDIISGAHEKTSTGEEDNKFGLENNEIYKLFDQYKNHPYLNLCALSMHIGSGVPSLDPFYDAFLRMSDMVKTLRSNGHTITDVDLGGGLWVPYEGEPEPPVDEYARMIAEIFLPLNLHVSVEPGRLLIAESSCLLTSVIYTKDRGSDKQFVIVDAGMNDLIRPTLYDAYHPIMAVHNKNTSEIKPRDLVGPVCETGDYFALDRNLPELNRGDLVAIMVTGAYGSVMSSHYNTRPLIAEIMIENNNTRLIRKAQPVSDLWRDEL